MSNKTILRMTQVLSNISVLVYRAFYTLINCPGSQLKDFFRIVNILKEPSLLSTGNHNIITYVLIEK